MCWCCMVREHVLVLYGAGACAGVGGIVMYTDYCCLYCVLNKAAAQQHICTVTVDPT
jgi:hypothetical protein